jgi:phosphopantetheine adenylyltransferase
MIDYSKPTTQLLGRFQPWHEGHTELFLRALERTGQVVILLRENDGDIQNNPYSTGERMDMIKKALYPYANSYTILPVPNITHITYGRDVGYTIEEEVLPENIQEISATKKREEMREC